MGNTESVNVGGDRPGPLIEEAKRNLNMGFPEAAVAKFRRAYELYKESGAMASAASNLRQAMEAGLTAKDPNFELAAKGFEEVGQLYLQCEITSGSAGAPFANSIYCLLASGKTSTAKDKFTEFSKLDSDFTTDVEGVAARVVLESFSNGNKNMTRDRFEALKEVVDVEPWRKVIFDAVHARL